MFYIILFAFCNEALNLVNLVAILPNFDAGVNLMWCVQANIVTNFNVEANSVTSEAS